MRMIEKLSDNFPLPTFGDAASRTKAFIHATQLYDDETLTDTIANFLAGKVKDHNKAYMPTAAQVGTECQKVSNERARLAEIDRKFGPNRVVDPNALPPPPKDADSIARVRAAMAKHTAQMAAVELPDQPPSEMEKRIAARLAADIPPQDEDSVRERLMGNRT